jgi:hypothetical protein
VEGWGGVALPAGRLPPISVPAVWLLAVWLLAVWLLAPIPVAGQLPGAGAEHPATAQTGTALVRGVEAIGVNPSALALPGTPRWSVTLLPGFVDRGITPLGWSAVTGWEGRSISRAQREDWLRRLELDGPLVGSAEARVSGAAVQYRGFGVQVTTRGVANVQLSPGAAELILFGNAGRTGAPAELDLTGSHVEGQALTTVGLGWGGVAHRGGDGPGRWLLALGGSVQVTRGHGLIMARGGGGGTVLDPPGVDIRFPALESTSGTPGEGMGATVAASWLRGPLVVSVVLHDVIQSFGWREEAFHYRAGEAVLMDQELDTDTDRRPVEEAPPALRAELASRGIPSRLNLGMGWEAGERVALGWEVARGSLAAAHGEVPVRFGMGTRLRIPLPGEPVFRGGVGVEEGSVDLAGGLGIRAGPVRFSSAVMGRPAGDRKGLGAALSVEVRGGR